MTHRARLGCICIDVKTDDLTDAAAFWSAALGMQAEILEGRKYASLNDGKGYPKFLLQAVDHEPHVHMDFETDDKEAEIARLEALGAKVVARIQTWIVMEAPTGHRFCIVGPQGDDFPGEATAFE